MNTLTKYLREILVVAAVMFTTSLLSAELRNKIVVLDTGIKQEFMKHRALCSEGHADFTKTSLVDVQGHGTNIAGIIASQIDVSKFCIVVVKYWHRSSNPNGKNAAHIILRQAWEYIYSLSPSYVNFSANGNYFFHPEFSVISKLIDSGVKVIVAAGNNSLNLSEGCNSFPACYFFNEPNFYVVRAKDLGLSNFKGPVNAKANGLNQCGFDVCLSGSSQATANFTAYLTKKGANNVK